MAHGALLGTPYGAVQGLLTWASNNWVFIDGKALLRGVDLEEFWAPRFIHVISELFVEDGMTEHADERDRARAAVMRKFLGYDSTEESYGRSNDNLGGQSQAPLPYVPPTEFSDTGYAGLDPPLG